MKNDDVLSLFIKQHMINRYLYTDDVKEDMDGDNVMALLYLARKYQVGGLEMACSNYLKEENLLAPESACFVYEQGFIFDLQTIMSDSRLVIQQNARECLHSEHFYNLRRECVADIIADDNLQIDEKELCRCVLQWAENECERQCISTDDASIRNILGDLLYKIRFPIMSEVDFRQCFASRSFLLPKEKQKIYDALRSIPVKEFEFSTKPRNLKAKIMRLTDETTNVDFNELHVIDFKTTTNVLLHGIVSYGPTEFDSHASKVLDVHLDITDPSGTELVNEDMSHSLIYNQKEYELLFTKAVRIEADIKYTVQFRFLHDSEWVWQGESGRAEVEHSSGFEVKFYENRKSTETTNVNKGQIPGLIISKA